MKKNSILLLVLSSILVTSFSSCSNYGKKVKIEGTKGEVYYKDGATEEEAKKVGDFLKKNDFFPKDKTGSVQLTKDGSEYTVRFVYDKDYFEKTPDLENVFKLGGVQMSKELFGGQKVNIALASNTFKDFKKIPYDEAFAKSLDAPKKDAFNKDDYDHDTAGGIDFYWKGIGDDESKTIADYIVKNGFFSGGGTVEIYMTKEGDRYLLQFPVKKEYEQDASVVEAIDKFSKEVKENVFADRPYTFQMTDIYLNVLKSFEY
jgi:hypothetical protein